MNEELTIYSSVADMLRATKPHRPVYCIYPDIYRKTASDFVGNFSGRVLYAVKANDHPEIIRLLVEGGVRHFDCASLDEIQAVKRASPEAACYFMTPVRLRGAAGQAQSEYGVRHFMIDHQSGLDSLAEEIDLDESVIFARMAVHHPAAMQDLSVRFGAPQEDIPNLLTRITENGAEAALAFNVGSNVSEPDAYRHAIGVAEAVLSDLPFRVRLVDIGGGFPKSYPGYVVPPLAEYFDAVHEAASALPLQEGGEILAEPGRALAAPGLSAVVEVLLRKERRLFLNDGMYGIFWELRFKGHDRFPVRCFRDGVELGGKKDAFHLFGPTCDSTDTLPGEVELPVDIRQGDHLEFGKIGAYSLAGRTNFNGFYSDDIVTIDHDSPPKV